MKRFTMFTRLASTPLLLTLWLSTGREGAYNLLAFTLVFFAIFAVLGCTQAAVIAKAKLPDVRGELERDPALPLAVACTVGLAWYGHWVLASCCALEELFTRLGEDQARWLRAQVEERVAGVRS